MMRPSTSGIISVQRSKGDGIGRTLDVTSVTFWVVTQPKGRGAFTVPKEVTRLLDVDSGDPIHLVIEADGRKHSVDTKLTSGTEVWDVRVRTLLRGDQRITITISR